jgi:hypothetical protein
MKVSLSEPTLRSGLCQYKHMFGDVNAGIHSYRLLNIAVVDVIFTLLGAFLLSNLFRVDFVYIACGLFALGIVCHRMFCVRTTVDAFLFP